MSKESSQSWEQIHFHIGDLNSGQSKKCIRTVLSKKRQNGRRTRAAHLSQMIVVAQSGQRVNYARRKRLTTWVSFTGSWFKSVMSRKESP